MKPILVAGAGVLLVFFALRACGGGLLQSVEDAVVDKAAEMAKEEALAAKEALMKRLEEMEGENQHLSRSLATVEARYDELASQYGELETRFEDLQRSADDLEAKAKAAEQNLAIERSSWSRLYAE